MNNIFLTHIEYSSDTSRLEWLSVPLHKKFKGEIIILHSL